MQAARPLLPTGFTYPLQIRICLSIHNLLLSQFEKRPPVLNALSLFRKLSERRRRRWCKRKKKKKQSRVRQIKPKSKPTHPPCKSTLNSHWALARPAAACAASEKPRGSPHALSPWQTRWKHCTAQRSEGVNRAGFKRYERLLGWHYLQGDRWMLLLGPWPCLWELASTWNCSPADRFMS